MAVEVVEVEGSRTSLSPADVRSAMPRRPTPSGRQRAGAGAAGSLFLSESREGDEQMTRAIAGYRLVTV